MCGIVAMLRNDKQRSSYEVLGKSRKLFSSLMGQAQRRGNAASGIFLSSTTPNNKSTIATLRCPLPAKGMLASAAGQRLLVRYDNNTNFIVGHTRAATGESSARNNFNNHPHRCGDIIGVHNGVINDGPLLKEMQGFVTLKGDCDSEALFSYLDYKNKNRDIRYTAISTLRGIEGAYALLFTDVKSPRNLFMIRNKKAPLEAAWWEEGQTLIVASEYSMIEKAAGEAGLRGPLQHKPITDNCLYRYDSSKAYENTLNLVRDYCNLNDSEDYINSNKEVYEKTQGG